MRRLGLLLAAALLSASLVPSAATAAPTECLGLFWGIEATCMFRSGGVNALVTGTAVEDGAPPAQFVVELWRITPPTLLAHCPSGQGAVQSCLAYAGIGSVAQNTLLMCRIHGIADIGTFACATF